MHCVQTETKTMQYVQTGESLGEFRTNKESEFVVSGDLEMGSVWDRMTLNVFKVQENGGRGELVEQYTRRYPVAPFGRLAGSDFNVIRKFRSSMLEKTFMDFEKNNKQGILFCLQ